MIKAHWISAYVLFRNERSFKGLRLLKKNFRHCAVILESDRHWLYLDQTFFQTEMRIWDKSVFPLVFFKKKGWKVLQVSSPASSNTNRFRFGWVDCVSMVKRVLGIKKRWVFTPYQLYKVLILRRI